MPELPEVETVCGAMRKHLIGRRIESVKTSRKKLREPLPQARLRALVGHTFTAARRRAKYLLLETSAGRTLVVHLGMSGNLIFRTDAQQHDHVIFRLDKGPPLVFSDPRRFGLVLVFDADELADCSYLRELGIEPLEDGFDGGYLKPFCRGSQRPIKNLIMDAHVVVGVGNIYASEALFKAGIRPTTRARRLSRARLDALAREIKQVLRASIRAGGTTIGDYVGSGSGGRFQQELTVYGRLGENCLVCDGPIRSLPLAGRSTFYCRQCQK